MLFFSIRHFQYLDEEPLTPVTLKFVLLDMLQSNLSQPWVSNSLDFEE